MILAVLYKGWEDCRAQFQDTDAEAKIALVDMDPYNLIPYYYMHSSMGVLKRDINERLDTILLHAFVHGRP